MGVEFAFPTRTLYLAGGPPSPVFERAIAEKADV
jgi:hypothetical protein